MDTKYQITHTNTTSRGTPHLSTEASQLGLPPGIWPETLPVAPDIGNGQPFLYSRLERMSDGEVISVEYYQQCGTLTLTVFND